MLLQLSESAQGAGGVGGLLMSETIAENGVETEPQFFHYDGNGNVTALTDDRGNQTATYRYDAFGNSLVTQGEKAVENEYRFSTKPLDEVSGLYYYGYRYYDPVTGRWPSRDPIEERGGVNLYASVNNDGLNQWDYLGLSRAGEEFANGSVTCTCDLIYECVPIDEDDSDCCGDVLEGSGNATERYVKSIGREEKKNRAEAEKAATIAAAKKAEEDAGNCPEKCVKWNIGGKCSCV